MVRVFAKWFRRPGFNPSLSFTKDKKWYCLLNTQHYKVWIKSKWSNPGGAAIEKEPSGHLQLRSANLYTCAHTHTYIYMYIYIYICRKIDNKVIQVEGEIY